MTPLYTPTKFHVDPSSRLGGVRTQTNKQTDKQTNTHTLTQTPHFRKYVLDATHRLKDLH